MFTNPIDVKAYALAGHATVTISSERTKAHYTYRITQAKDDAGKKKDLWFVGLLSGPDITRLITPTSESSTGNSRRPQSQDTKMIPFQCEHSGGCGSTSMPGR